jgi:hypothetical protein
MTSKQVNGQGNIFPPPPSPSPEPSFSPSSAPLILFARSDSKAYLHLHPVCEERQRTVVSRWKIEEKNVSGQGPKGSGAGQSLIYNPLPDRASRTPGTEVQKSTPARVHSASYLDMTVHDPDDRRMRLAKRELVRVTHCDF